MTCQDAYNTILPAVNDIWKTAGVQFTMLNCDTNPSITPTSNTSVYDEEGLEYWRCEKLFTFAIHDYTADVNVYVVPFIVPGMTGYYTEYADGFKYIVISETSTVNSPLLRTYASIANTLAHELGHFLGLVHPRRALPSDLMNAQEGDFLCAKTLSCVEISIARENARVKQSGVKRIP